MFSLNSVALSITLSPLVLIASADARPLHQVVPPVIAPIGEISGRDQLGPRASGRFVVWQDRPAETDPTDISWFNNSDIRGYDLQGNQPLLVSDAPGRQAMADVSNTLAVWEDMRHSCPTCDADIRGKNLETGQEFIVADGPADQSSPAIEGQIVAWIEFDGLTKRLLATDLETREVVEVASVPLGVTIGPPAISTDLIVWGEITPSSPYVLKAYDFATRTTIVVGEAYHLAIGTNYDVDGRIVVWAAPQLMLSDLNTGDTSMVVQVAPTSPRIAGQFVVWAAPGPGLSDESAIYGMSLQQREPVLLVAIDGDQRAPTLTDTWLIWQSGEPGRAQRILDTLLIDAFAGGTLVPEPSGPQPDSIAAQSAPSNQSHATTKTTPTAKGMHTAIGGGWQVTGVNSECVSPAGVRKCPSVDALGTSIDGPYFGSLLVVDFDLKDISAAPGIQHRMTGRCTQVGDPDCGRWGPAVYDVMRYFELPASEGGLDKRVVVRTNPTRAPDNVGTNVHHQVVQDILDLVHPGIYNYDWIRHIQVNNEPNLEWPTECKDCFWADNDAPANHTWSGIFDPRLYIAIDDFYTDVWWSLNWHQNNNPDSRIRERLSAITFWTPPMADVFGQVGEGTYFYNYLHGMIWQYRQMTYHTYPAPNGPYDVDGNGGLRNRSWDFFDQWVIDRINDASVPSMITEFGWNPDQMIDCNMTQQYIWSGYAGAHEAERCIPFDGVDHTLEEDIHRFLTGPELRRAEAVMVWLVKGWEDRTGQVRADGLASNGTQWWWLHAYQWSSP